MASANIGDDKTQSPNPSQYENKTEAQGGISEGSSGGPWSTYLTETERQDKEMVERWKGEADSTLIFAGLFSAVVTVSIVESYKWLSPDSGDETVRLLAQISRQLVNISNGTPIPLESIEAGINQPFQPTTAAILVNVTWLLSIAGCISCSVGAALIQQWARRYLVLVQGPERAHLRTFMFNGLRKFQVERFIQFVAISLHSSILLYAVGMFKFFYSFNSRIGYTSLAICLLLGVIYGTLTAFPLIFFDAPYSTPWSAVWWRSAHAIFFCFFSTIRYIGDLFHDFPSTLWNRSYRHVRGSRSRVSQWRETLEKRINKHKQWFYDGLQRSIEHYATEAPQPVDVKALEETFTTLVENDSDKEVESIAAWIPEFFDTCALTCTRSGAEGGVVPLTSDQPPINLTLGYRLHQLLKTCIPGTSILAEEERRRRLRVCLKCLWCWLKAYDQYSMPLPFYFPLPDPDMTRHLQAEQDPTANMMGRCFGALVGKGLAADLNLRHHTGVDVRDAKMASLSTILGSTSTEVETFISQPGAIGLANIVSLMSVNMDALITEKAPSEALDLFERTLDSLLSKDFLTSLDERLPPNLIARFEETYSNARRLQILDWLTNRLLPIMDKLAVGSNARQSRDNRLDGV
ncbi:hypothetical protein EDB83DRAFT_2528784 [Lactarius deliciosus]|nr:hypothetical protein EDB83DRAFT_2528784 [Lactarius deliciosus]